MIDGIKFEVTSEEMSRLFAARAAYHRLRGTQQAEELPKLKAIIEGLKVPSFTTDGGMPGITYGNSQYAGRDPVAELEQRIANHKQNEAKFSFYAGHVIKGEVHRVDPSDLRVLGIDDGDWAAIAFAVRK